MSKNCEVIIYLLDNYIRYGTKLYKQIVGIPIETNCVSLVADFFLLLLFIFYLIFILFFFVMGEISCHLSVTKVKLIYYTYCNLVY